LPNKSLNKIILIQHGCAYTLSDEMNMLASMSQKENANMINKYKNIIISCFGDKASKGVTKERLICQYG